MPLNWSVFVVASGLILPKSGVAQTPVVGAVVNAASFIQAPAIGHALVPGSLATIFGENLAPTTVTGSPPYPFSLGGTSVSIGGLPAPLLYVSPTQINFQVPAELPFSQVPLIVQTPIGQSATTSVDLYASGFGIFTLDGSGCGPAPILNVKPDGSLSLNSPGNSAEPGDYLEIFGTGLAVETPTIPDANPAPLTPDPINMYILPIGSPGIGAATYAGRAPGLVGVDQVNVRISQASQQGCSIPFSIGEGLGGLIGSQLVPVSIHAGGGTCVDPPQQGSGQITLQRTLFMNSSQPEADLMTASFIASPSGSTSMTGGTLALAPSWGYAVVTRQDRAAACGTPGIQPMSIGTMAVQSSGLGSIQATTTSTQETLLHTATLPAGAISRGAYTITASGVGGVDPIQVSLNTGPPIQPAAQFPQSPNPAAPPLFTVTWTGGDSTETVSVRIVQHSSSGLTDIVVSSAAPANAQVISIGVGIPISSHGVVSYLPVFQSGPIELDVDVVPASPLPAFTAPGLTGGVTATWVYEYRFTGVMP